MLKNLISKKRKIWTKDEDNFLKTNFSKLGGKYCSFELNRTLAAIYQRCHFLELQRYTAIAYITPELLQDEHLNKKKSITQIAKELHTTRQTISWLCKKYKIKITRLRPDFPENKKRKDWTGVGDLSTSVFHHIQRSAERRNIEFKIDIKYAWKLFEKQNKICPYTGLELKICLRNKKQKDTTASLDRIDSSKGYIKGNLQWIYKPIQKMKMCLSEENFIEYITLIAKHRKLND